MSVSADALRTERRRVRSQGRARRTELQGLARATATASLIAHLRSMHAVRTASTVGVFVADDGEPDLSAFVHDVWSSQGETGSFQQVALPVLSDDPDDFSMTYVAWTANERLVPARFGIPVPATRQPIEPDLILAPFTGFDSGGNRIGRGGGFFDRFLASTTARVVGVGFECQRFDAIPVEPHDVALSTIVTDLGVRYLT